MPGKRVFGLDVFRAIAVLLVVFGHGMQLLPGYGAIANFSDKFFYLGVELFFVLSGFLIGGILIKTIDVSSSFNCVLNFWKRRWWRTLPNYYLFLLINLVGFGLLKPDFTFSWSYLFFVQNFLAPNAGFFSVSWSLAVEEWFYLLTPLIYFAFLGATKKVDKAFWLTCIIVIAVSMLARIYYILQYDVSWNLEIRKVVLLRLDSLIYGVIVAWFWLKFHAVLQKNRLPLFMSGLFFLGISIAIKNNPAINNSGLLLFFLFPAASLGAALCLPLFASWSGKVKQFLGAKFVTCTSLWSYSLYLVHIPLLEIYRITIFPLLKDSLVLQAVGFSFWLSLSYLFSFFIFRYFENPIMQFREYKLFDAGRFSKILGYKK